MKIEDCRDTRTFHSVYNDDRQYYGDASEFPHGTHATCRWCNEPVVFIEATDDTSFAYAQYGTWITELHILEWP